MNRPHLLPTLLLGLLAACTPTLPEPEAEAPSHTLEHQEAALRDHRVMLWWGGFSCASCGLAPTACSNGWGDWNNGEKSFQDPLPPGRRLVKVIVRVFGQGVGDYPVMNVTPLLNGMQLGQETVRGYPVCRNECSKFEKSLENLSGVPNYVYGGINKIRLVPDGTFCAAAVEVLLISEWPKIKLSASVLDFGEVRKDYSAEQVLEISNVGEDLLTIKSLALELPFQLSPAPPLPFNLRPGEARNFKLLFSPTALGTFSKELRIGSNDLSLPTASVQLVGKGVEASILVQPLSLDFGDQRVNQTSLPLQVVVANNGTATLEVSSINISDGFQVTPSTPFTLEPGSSRGLEVLFAPTQALIYSGALSLTTNDPNRGLIQVALAGRGVVPDLRVTPTFIDFGYQPVGSTGAGRLVQVQNNGLDTLTFSSISLSVPQFVTELPPLPFKLAPGARSDFTVRLSSSVSGTYTGTMNFESDDPDMPRTSVSLLGTAALPSIVANPSSLDFSNQRVGTTSAGQKVTLSNTGTYAMAINSISTAGPFRVVGPSTPFSLAAEATQDLTVSFTPLQAGEASGTVVLTTSDPVVPTITLTLSGNGWKPEMALSHSALEFGEVRTGTATSLTLYIANGGTSPLTINSVTVGGADAARFSLSLPTQPFTVDPGASIPVAVTFQPDTVRAYSASLVVSSDDPKSPSVLVALSGIGIASALRLSPTLLDFGSVLIGNPSAPRSLSITNAGSSSVTLMRISLGGAAAAQFTLVTPPQVPLTLAPGAQTQVQVAFTPSAGAEAVGRLVVTSDDPGAAEVGADLRGTGLSSLLSVSTTRLDFGTVDVDDLKYGQVVLTNVSSQMIELAPPKLLSSQRDQFVYDLNKQQLMPGESATFEIIYEAKGPSTFQATVIFDVDVPSQPRAAEVVVTGKVVSSLLEVSPLTLDFGRVDVGSESAPQEVYLINRYTTPREVEYVDYTSEDFPLDVEALQGPINPGEMATIRVKFRPRAAGEATGSLAIRLVGDAAPTASIQMKGLGRSIGLTGGGQSCGATGGGLGLLGLLALWGLGRRREARA